MSIYESIEWAKLKAHKTDVIDSLHLRDLMKDADRCSKLTVTHGDITMDFSRENVTTETIDLLCGLAKEAKLEEKIAAMGAGAKINVTEGRAVGHMALRAPKDATFNVDGKNVVPDVHAVLTKIKAFADKVRSGEWLGATGKKLTSVVSIGIGGSYLGPEFVFEALRTDETASAAAQGRSLRFLANVDPVDAARALSGMDAETTLVIIVSKTFTTAETMLNARTIKDWIIKNVAADAATAVSKHMIACSTAIPKVVDFGISQDNIFGFWDWVGGRYSVCSAVGVVPLAIHYGFDIVEQFLNGAADMDSHFQSAPLNQNLPVMLGMLGLWNSSFMGHQSRAILPYAQALIRFAAHIQQVDMESNGKRVAMDGSVLPIAAGEIVFGEPGTNGQHSFYQLIHQGRTVPCEFIGFCQSPSPMALAGEPVSNHDELMCNFFAQPDALAYGKTIEELKASGVSESLHAHKEFPGNKPSLSLLFQALTPFSCGQLLALYEHRVAVQGFVWGLNSFDQWGVELGKALAGSVRKSLSAARTDGGSKDAIQGFNPSTTALLEKYLG